MIFNMVGAAGGVKFMPQYDGYWNLVLGKDGKSGYAEFYGSGTLTWRDNIRPPVIDVTCIGGGGGGRHSEYNPNVYGYGGAGGQVVSMYGITPPESVNIVVGAGGKGGVKNTGTAPTNGGSSSFGSFCTANGGTANVNTGAGHAANGRDVLGRRHAGGGAAGRTSGSNSTPLPGGETDYPKRGGVNGQTVTHNSYVSAGGAGGGGAGGGGGGSGLILLTVGGGNGGAGGDGLVVMAWGNYLAMMGD